MLKLFGYLKRYWFVSLLAPLLMVVEVSTDLLRPYLMANIIDHGIATGDIAYIFRTGFLMIGLAVVGIAGGFGCTIAASIAGQSLGTDVRADLFKKVQSFSFTNLDKFETASLITRLTNDVNQVQNMVMMSLRMMVRAPLLCIGGIVMAVLINARLAMILYVLIPLLVIGLIWIVRRGYPLFKQVQTRLDRVNTVMRENLAGVRVVKAFVRANHENVRFGAANDEFMDTSIRAGRVIALVWPFLNLMMNVSVVAVLWFGGVQVNQGTILIGEVVAFISYMFQILFSLLMLAFVVVMFSRAKASADRIHEVLNTDADIVNPLQADMRPIEEGAVEFDDVTFRYAGAQGPPVLKNISFQTAPGETVALLGGTGAGKTTLVSLIPRLYDVTEGTIRIDGRDIRTMDLKALRQGIGMVLQSSVLFSGTIRDNLKWGNRAAEEEAVQTAAEQAQAHGFITETQYGYDSLLGQRGVNLSGGQKQRISIARALLKGAPILILDDSTSAVDLRTEAKIQQAFRRSRKITTFLIAQRISSVMHADKIIVLDDGRIEAMGTHEELLRTSAIYQDIFESQMGEGAVVHG